MRFFKRTKSRTELLLEEIKKNVDKASKRLDEIHQAVREEDEKCPTPTASEPPLKLVR
jgi:hypothetical protein